MNYSQLINFFKRKKNRTSYIQGLKYRPDFLKHRTPLDLNEKNKETLVKYPKIITRGALSQAVPFSEIKYYKNVSDMVGSNYSPFAKNLSTKTIYELAKKGELQYFY